MKETEFTQQDIDGLAAKMADLDLSNAERALLSGLLSHAAETLVYEKAEPGASPVVEERAVVIHADELPSIREQLARAFAPGAVPKGARAARIRLLGGSVGGGPMQ